MRHAGTLIGVALVVAAYVLEDGDALGAADQGPVAPAAALGWPQRSAAEPAAYRGMLERHNRWRRVVGAPDLVWSAQAAQQAQRWADQLAREQCEMRHNPDPARRQHYGENIYRYWRSAPYAPWKRKAPYVVDAWAAEAQWYDLATGRCDAPEQASCGHYTQLIWATSQAVGCGRAHCGSSEVWVCNYAPRGNYVGLHPLAGLPAARGATADADARSVRRPPPRAAVSADAAARTRVP